MSPGGGGGGGGCHGTANDVARIQTLLMQGGRQSTKCLVGVAQNWGKGIVPSPKSDSFMSRPRPLLF